MGARSMVTMSLLGLLVAGAALPARAQVSLAPGAQLLVQTPRASVAGRLITLSDSALVLQRELGGDTVVIPLDIVRNLQVAHGSRWVRVPLLTALEAAPGTTGVRKTDQSADSPVQESLVGRRIRYEVLGEAGTKRTGQVLREDAAVLMLLSDGAAAPTTVPRRFLRKLEIGGGTTSDAAEVSRVGALMGGAILATYWTATVGADDILPPGTVNILAAGAGAAVGGAVGALVGAALGSLHRYERWVPLPGAVASAGAHTRVTFALVLRR